MRNTLILIFAVSFFAGCGAVKSGSSAARVNDTIAAIPQKPVPSPTAVDAGAPSYMTISPADAEVQKILGSYVGAFGDNKITLMISKAAGNTISGRSIVGGNDRPFEGTYSAENGVYNVSAKEPGDHKDDGIFNFTVSASDPSKVSGTWQANDTKRPQKSYTLERRKFQYRPDVGEYPQASTRALKASEVENLTRVELQMMRQEIFARHGYCFNTKEFRQRFENEDWYVPDTVDIRGRLTDLEKKNIALIKRYEKYAEKYGDDYGR
jgi:hypothetical protein